MKSVLFRHPLDGAAVVLREERWIEIAGGTNGNSLLDVALREENVG